MDYSLAQALTQFLNGLFFGFGFSLAFYVIGLPLRRWYP